VSKYFVTSGEVTALAKLLPINSLIYGEIYGAAH
jgi:hypothetical protein